LTAVDLYSGSGAVTAALKQRHFRVVAAVDNDPIACETYRRNHPAVRIIEKDIRRVDPSEIRRKDLGGSNLDLLVVCAPCQPFSSQNRKKGCDDRSDLILEAGRFARVLRPRVILFENVPGLASPRHSRILKALKRELGKQYKLSMPERVDAADFGVPQRRIRCIMLATRGASPPKLCEPITPDGERVTVRKTIGKLRPLRSGESDPKDVLHSARTHQHIALERLAAIPKDGGSRSAIPKRLQLTCHTNVGSTKFPDVYGRMKWDDVAPTLTTGCTDITRGRFAHPRDDRAITLREAALLQTFPREYHFSGYSGDIHTQIGNAVPVQLIDALVPTLRTGIKRARS
jgi:DNA (cytosine-5)-methyltransferase 1